MRRSLVAVVGLFSLAGAAVPARAAVITQVVGALIQPQGANSAHDISADPFFPSTGTLTGVTLELRGVVIPKGDGLAGPTPTLTTSVTVVPVNGGPDSFTRSFPSEVATFGGVVGEGPDVLQFAPSFMIDEIFTFSDLTRFLFTGGDPVDLIDYGFSTASSAGPFDLDRTSFTGSATLIYTYSPAATSPTMPTGIPEPASSTLLWFGTTAFVLARRLRKAPR